MTWQGLVGKCVVMCIVLGTLVGQASAHGSEDIPTGIVLVPPSGTASITIAYVSPSDTIQWESSGCIMSWYRSGATLIWSCQP